MDKRITIKERERMSPEERFSKDPNFSMLVRMLYEQIQMAQFTPTELREAVTLACIQYEIHNPRPFLWYGDKQFLDDKLKERQEND